MGVLGGERKESGESKGEEQINQSKSDGANKCETNHNTGKAHGLLACGPANLTEILKCVAEVGGNGRHRVSGVLSKKPRSGCPYRIKTVAKCKVFFVLSRLLERVFRGCEGMDLADRECHKPDSPLNTCTRDKGFRSTVREGKAARVQASLAVITH